MRRVITKTFSDREQKVEDALVEMGVTYDVAYLGEREDSEKWKHDDWMFQFVRNDGAFRQPVAAMRQSYRTGTGHRKPPPGALSPRPPYRPGTLAHEDWLNTFCAVKPPAAGVLGSLFVDASGAESTFEDWCGDFGYDSDSIKALNIYRACQQIVLDLRKFFARGQVEQLEQLLEGY
ncbi:hypothetical protein J7E62_24560 [Variovorax paradoxus]|nr:hypothetical protein [Variovorax paradoxus]